MMCIFTKHSGPASETHNFFEDQMTRIIPSKFSLLLSK